MYCSMTMKRDMEYMESEYEYIRKRLAESPGSWVCLMCEEVFGPEVRADGTADATAPDLMRIVEPGQNLCGECSLVLTTTPPPNVAWIKGSEPS